MSAPAPDRLLARAVELALDWHGDQRRKSGGAPYVSHLLQVSGLVLEHGGTMTQAAAGVLHDAVEDTDATLDDIEAELGPEVAAIVGWCTDTLEGDTPDAKSPWRQRKVHYLERLAQAPDDAVLVAACDKRHNLGTLAADVRAAGPRALDVFNAGPDDQLWYYAQLLDVLAGRIPPRLEAELLGLVDELRRGLSRPSRDGG